MLGKIASLNISVAAGVVLYEVVRQTNGVSDMIARFEFFALRPVEDPKYLCYSQKFVDAGVAQLVEQLTCNQQVGGSSPFASSW